MSELEIVSQNTVEEQKHRTPVQLVNFTCRDLPLAVVDFSLTRTELLPEVDQENPKNGSQWIRPCCGRQASMWQMFLLSAGLNCSVVLCTFLVVILLIMELLIDLKLLSFTNAFQFAAVSHWVSLVLLSIFLLETVLRLVIFGIWEYVENKLEVFDGAVVVLSLASMVASTVVNGPSSPWDAFSLFIILRLWRFKWIVDAYVLPLKVELELVIQQYEKAKATQEEQLERLTQICQDQAFEIRQLRAHLAQQDLDLSAEREAAMQVPIEWSKDCGRFKVVDQVIIPHLGDDDDERTENITISQLDQENVVADDMNNYINQFLSEPSSEMGVPDAAACMITTSAVDVHYPNISNDLLSAVPSKSEEFQSTYHKEPDSVSIASSATLTLSASSQVFCSSTDCSTREESSDSCLLERNRTFQNGQTDAIRPRGNSTGVQGLLSSLPASSRLTQQGLSAVSLLTSSPSGSTKASPVLGCGISIHNRSPHVNFNSQQLKPVMYFHKNVATIEEKYKFLESKEQALSQIQAM
ncbi:transmembrane protein 266 [Protopterus annectens]|uniref:transmembrane protein 266 n=1 Tax=Protopterus annectens TaxID=7888 RepID=UPI001CF9AC2C|nr:transmembrane protein 266 [Protopterus annectens]